MILFKKPEQFSKYLGYFGNIICCLELSNIAKSGRTDPVPRLDEEAGSTVSCNTIFLFFVVEVGRLVIS